MTNNDFIYFVVIEKIFCIGTSNFLPAIKYLLTIHSTIFKIFGAIKLYDNRQTYSHIYGRYVDIALINT